MLRVDKAIFRVKQDHLQCTECQYATASDRLWCSQM